MEQLHSVCMFVEPYTYVWEKRRPPGQPLPVFEGVDAGDFHNIQTHIDDYESWMVIFLQDRFIRGLLIVLSFLSSPFVTAFYLPLMHIFDQFWWIFVIIDDGGMCGSGSHFAS